MRNLTMDELASVDGGIYNGQCNQELFGYVAATVSLVASVASGPLLALSTASWIGAVAALNSCASGTSRNYGTIVDNYGCHMVC